MAPTNIISDVPFSSYGLSKSAPKIGLFTKTPLILAHAFFLKMGDLDLTKFADYIVALPNSY